MVGDGKAVGLIPDFLEERQGFIVPGNEDGIGAALPEDQLFFLSQTENRKIFQAQAPDDLQGTGKLPLASVDDHQVRKGLPFHTETPAQNLLHRGEVIRTGHAADPEFPVSALIRTPSGKDHHAGHCVGTADIGDIVAFHAPGRGLQAQIVLQGGQPFGHLPFLVGLNLQSLAVLLCSIGFSHIQKPPLLPLPGLEKADLPALPVGEEFLQGGILRGFGKDQLPGRDMGGIILLQKGGEAGGPVFSLLILDEIVFFGSEVPLPEEEDHHRCLSGAQIEAHHIPLYGVALVDDLLLGQPADQVQLIPDLGSLLKFHSSCKGLHLFLEAPEKLFFLAGKEEGGLPDHLSVLLFPHIAHTGGLAAMDLILEAGPGTILQFLVSAGPEGEEAFQDVQDAAHAAYCGIGAEIQGAILRLPAHHLDPGEGILETYFQVRVVLVIPEDDIVPGTVLPDQVGLQDQGFHLITCEGPVDVPDLLHQSTCLGILAPSEIAGDPVFQVHGLSHIKDLAPLIQHLIDPGGWGQGLQLV